MREEIWGNVIVDLTATLLGLDSTSGATVRAADPVLRMQLRMQH